MDAQVGKNGGNAKVPVVEEPAAPQNLNPSSVLNIYYTAVDFLQTYGWLLVFTVLVCFVIKRKIGPKLDRLRRKWQDYRERAKYDEDAVMKDAGAMAAARRRLQEVHDAKAALYAEEAKVKEGVKRQEKIEDWDKHQDGRGYRNKYKPSTESAGGASSSSGTKKKNVYRSNDYNPLMGSSSGTSCSWTRPSRRGGAGGGG